MYIEFTFNSVEHNVKLARNYTLLMLRRWALDHGVDAPAWTCNEHGEDYCKITVELARPEDYTLFMLGWDLSVRPMYSIVESGSRTIYPLTSHSGSSENTMNQDP